MTVIVNKTITNCACTVSLSNFFYQNQETLHPKMSYFDRLEWQEKLLMRLPL
jgi:hypothetical protein